MYHNKENTLSLNKLRVKYFGVQIMKKELSKYEIIKQDLKQKIEAFELKPNQVIPSENMLCEEYQVSRITVRKAIDELVHEEFLYRIKGKGCFVREKSTHKLSRIYSFTEAIVQEGKVPSKEQLLMKKEKAGDSLGKKFGIEADAEVCVIKSVYFADGEPYCVNTSVLPAELFPKLDFFDFNNNSLYEVLKSFYKLEITKVRQTISAINGDEELQKYLKIDDKKPLLKIDAVSYGVFDNKERVFEVYECNILTDTLSYFVEKYNR